MLQINFFVAGEQYFGKGSASPDLYHQTGVRPSDHIR